MKWLFRVGMSILALVVMFIFVAAILVWQWVHAPLPQLDGSITLNGIDNPVTILRDEWGVPHIYASTTTDLRFAQGYVHAQDRWWQMEFARHVARGAIEELTGQNADLLGDDIFIRTAGWHRTSQQELAQLPPDILNELQAFSDGVNAYISSRTPGELALEYRILGLTGIQIEVKHWTPLDSLSTAKLIAWDLSSNARKEELLRSAMVGTLGAELTDAYFSEFPYGEKPTHISSEDLATLGNLPTDPSLDQQALSHGNPPHATPYDAGISGLSLAMAGNIGLKDGFWLGSGEGIGSNAWVVSGELTASGLPLLANDPHLGVQLPSIWYEIGLHCQPVAASCPYNVHGFAYTGLPGVVMGASESLAWGITSFSPDLIDFYRLEINPENENQYRWNDEWRDLVIHEEEIRFGDGGSLTIRVRDTHFGPVMTDNQLVEQPVGEGTESQPFNQVSGFVNQDVLAMRWTGWDPSLTVQALIEFNRATNWDSFRSAANLLDVPALNLIYADKMGNIGFQPAGRFPVRAGGHTGLLPVDGKNDSFEWRGFIPFNHLPSVYNPKRGYITLANQAAAPLAYYDTLATELADEFGPDAYYRFRTDWARGYRGQRLAELFQAYDVHTIGTTQAMHADNKIIIAEEISPYLAAIDMGDDQLNGVRDWLLEWDYQMHMESPRAALFGVFLHQLLYDIFEDQLSHLADPNGEVNNMLALAALMKTPSHPWWDDVATDQVETRDLIVQRAFANAHTKLIEKLGADQSGWRWGALHKTNFTAIPLGASGVGLIEDLVNISGVETSGGAATLNATRWDYSDENPFSVTTIPGQRMIIDLSDYSNNLATNSTGQSGHAFSPHYADMIDDWRLIRYHTMGLWSEALQDTATHSLQLIPQK
ncbi:MAG: penicillin acylase family protein [Chloroflexota bacterium]